MKRDTQKLRCLLLLVCAFFLAQRASASASFPKSGAHSASASQFVIADFDGDSRPDLATVEIADVHSDSAQYAIRIHFASGIRESLRIIAALGGLRLVPRDVNGDLALDLVVSSALLHQPVAVLLNDGHGRFSPAPAATISAIADRFESRRRGLSPIGPQLAENSLLALSGRLFGDEWRERVLDLPRALSQSVSLNSLHTPLPVLGRLPSGRAPPPLPA